MTEYKNLTNKTPLDFFKEISLIPRGSGNEKQIAEHIEKFALERGYFCVRDEAHNVFVRRNASCGCDDKPPVMFQAHTDMVCEKTPESDHDFLKDPIKLIIDGDIITADGTTLGADDGAGVAMMMALLDKENLVCPETEFLFTSSEETGMDGIYAFDFSMMKSERVINLDSEDELDACISCAGGIRTDITIPVTKTALEGTPYKIEIGGLCGGHSGIAIDSGKKSAIKLMGTALDALYAEYPLHLVDIIGGGKDNVIPPSCVSYVVFYDGVDAKVAKSKLTALQNEIKSTLIPDERKSFRITIKKATEDEADQLKSKGMLTLKSTSALISAIMLMPQGVTDVTHDDKVVLASSNCGSIRINGDNLEMGCLTRACKAYYSEQTVAAISRMAHILGGEAVRRNSYPGWEYVRGSAMQSAYSEACKTVFGKEPSFYTIHAGLECGVIAYNIAERGGKADIIAIGPNMRLVHSPNEYMEISSLDRLMQVSVRLLETLGTEE